MAVKIRTFPESNYKAAYFNGKTIRFQIDGTKDILDLEYPEFYDIKLTNRCNGRCPFCFLPNTKIYINNGQKNISDIKIDDEVLSYNEKDKTVELEKVVNIFERNYKGKIISIELENNVLINVTTNHKIYTNNRGWIMAKDLMITDEIFYLN